MMSFFLLTLAWLTMSSIMKAEEAKKDAAVSNATAVSPETLWHVLSPEIQHSLAGALTHHGVDMDHIETAFNGWKHDKDPEVDFLLSSLLHDELDSQYKKQLAKEDQMEKELDKRMEVEKKAQQKFIEDKKHEIEALEARRKAHVAAREADKIEHEIDLKNLKNAQKQAEDEKPSDSVKLIDFTKGLLETSRQRNEESKKRREEMEKRHAKTWERASGLLQKVHSELEKATDGWRDAPFWDDFFRTSSAATRLSQLSFSHIEPALRASSLMPEHKVLVLEPKGAGLAERLAKEIRGNNNRTDALGYGAEGDEGRDVVVELGLLDAMAMGGGEHSEEATKLGALKIAAARLAKLVKPGGTWISISAVPPTLRVPLLGRLAGGMFSLPSEKEDASAGTHTLVLRAPSTDAKPKAQLRGQQVADMLLYGSEDVHVWAYRMQRGHDIVDEHVETAGSTDALLDIIRNQHPAPRSNEL